MSDLEPPAYLDGPQGDYSQGGGNRRAPQQKLSEGEQATLAADFFKWLDSVKTRRELAQILPDYIDIDVFLNTARAAAMAKPELLEPALRQSLLLAVGKAAAQGLLPDGSQGALVKRYDTDARCHRVVWQPMVKGIMKLGRLTGAIQKIRAVIVFHGEDVEFDEADGTVRHKRGADALAIVDDAYEAIVGAKNSHGYIQAKADLFFQKILCAYCIITAPDGTQTMRWMPAGRIALVRNASPAKNGPWNSLWIDEMVIKTVILFASKHVDLDISNPATSRFREALETDMQVDFEAITSAATSAAVAATAGRGQAALPAPGTRLDILADIARQREMVPVGEAEEEPPLRQTGAQDGGRGQTAAPPSDQSPSGAGSPPDGVVEGGNVSPSLPPSEPPAQPQGAANEVDKLLARVETAEKEIAGRTPEQVEKMVANHRYKDFIAELHRADRMDLVKRIATVVENARKGGDHAH